MGYGSWVKIWPKFYHCNCCVVCIIISYITTIYRESIVASFPMMLSWIGSVLIKLSLSSMEVASQMFLKLFYCGSMFCNIEHFFILWHIVLQVLKLTPKEDSNINFYTKSMVCLIMQAARVSAFIVYTYPDSKVHGVNMWPSWVLPAPDEPHVGPMNLAIRVVHLEYTCQSYGKVNDRIALWKYTRMLL